MPPLERSVDSEPDFSESWLLDCELVELEEPELEDPGL
jgi:hypothetical protein